MLVAKDKRREPALPCSSRALGSLNQTFRKMLHRTLPTVANPSNEEIVHDSDANPNPGGFLARLREVCKRWGSTPGQRQTNSQLRLRHCIEAGALETAVLVVSVFVFFCKEPLEYVLLPLLIWAALRFGVLGAIACGLTIIVLSTLSTALGFGPFVHSTSRDSLISLYAFLAVTIVCTLYLAGVFAERMQAESEVRRLNAELEQLVLNRTAQLEATNQELSRSNAELGEFAHVASHDLKEPLRTVNSCVQILQKRYAGALDAHANGTASTRC